MAQRPVRPQMPADVVDDFTRVGDAPEPVDDFVQTAQAPAEPVQPGVTLNSSDQPPEQREDGLLMRGAKAVGRGALAVGQGLADLETGIVKGVANTAIGAGKLVQQVPGVTRATDALYGFEPGTSARAMDDAREAIQPEGAMQNIGFYGEQIGEAFIPATKVGTLSNAIGSGIRAGVAKGVGQTAAKYGTRAAAEGANAAAHSYVQGGDPETAGVIGAALPGVGGVVSAASKTKVARHLGEMAEKRIHQAMSATTRRYKAMAERVVPEMLRRGMGKNMSREELLTQVQDTTAAIADDLDVALQHYAQQPAKGPKKVLDALNASKEQFQNIRNYSFNDAMKQGLIWYGKGRQIMTAKGVEVLPGGDVRHIVELNPRALRQLEKVIKLFKELPNPNVGELVKLRRTWDGIVDQAGGYAEKAKRTRLGQTLAEETEEWAQREGANAIRRLIEEETPDLAKINREFSFHKRIQDILEQTDARTLAQRGDLVETIAEAGGMALGGGSAMKGWALGKVMKTFNRVRSSPRWRFTTGHMRYELARAIMNDDVDAIMLALARMAAVQGGKGGSDNAPSQQLNAPPGRGPGGAAAFTPVGDFEVREVQ